MLSNEHKTDSTTCLSGHVQICVKARIPLCGSTFDDMYMLWLVMVSSRRSISLRLLSNSLVVATDVLQPTPLCQMAYDTFGRPLGCLGRVRSEKNSKSTKVSISSSARGLASSKSSFSFLGGFWPS